MKIVQVLVISYAVALAHAQERGHINKAREKPNIIVIVADDLGWGHVGWQNPKVLTPHLDHLAEGGRILNRHYVAPVCSPTRVAFMTGRYWSRFRCNNPLPSEPDSKARAMPRGTGTIASSLKVAGYRTALVGKWHLGAAIEDGPERFGFDHFYGLRVGGMTPMTHRWLGLGKSVLWRNNRIVEEQGHVTDLLAQEAVHWIGSPGQSPFFLYLAFTSPHVPLREPERWMNLYKDTAPDLSHQLYWAAISHLDDAVGQVMTEVARVGQRDNTLVVFFSDNGAPGQPNRMQAKADVDAYLNVTLPGINSPFRGKKGDLYEGGIRVPALAFWPGHLQPGICDDLMHVADWMPTLCSLVDHRPAKNLNWDGRDIWPVLSGGRTLNAPRTLYFKAPREQMALRQGDWKLILGRKGNPQLYNLTADPAERINQAADKPDVLQQLRTLLEAEAAKDGDAIPPRSQP